MAGSRSRTTPHCEAADMIEIGSDRANNSNWLGPRPLPHPPLRHDPSWPNSDSRPSQAPRSGAEYTISYCNRRTNRLDPLMAGPRSGSGHQRPTHSGLGTNSALRSSPKEKARVRHRRDIALGHHRPGEIYRLSIHARQYILDDVVVLAGRSGPFRPWMAEWLDGLGESRVEGKIRERERERMTRG